MSSTPDVVLAPPMFTHRTCKPFRICRYTTDVLPPLHRGCGANRSGGFDHAHPPQSCPLNLSQGNWETVSHPLPPKLIPAVPRFLGFKRAHLLVKLGKAGMRLVPQTALGGFDRQPIVRPLLDHLFRTVLLAPDRIDGHDTARHSEQLEQLWNGRDRVGMGVHGHLTEDEAMVAGPCTHHLEGGLVGLTVVPRAKRWTVNRNHLTRRLCCDSAGPTNEGRSDPVGVAGGKHAGERGV